MPIFKARLSDGRVARIESPTEPTEEQVLNLIKQQESPIFTRAQLQPTAQGSPPSPLNFGQQLVMGFTSGPESKIEFLQQEFQDAELSRDREGNILLNGIRVNPKGFEFTDITRNLGFAIPLIGQVIGGIKGLAVGAPAGPGAVGTAIAGGVAGASVGEAIRLGIGKLLGLEQRPSEVLGSLATEAALATGGEVVGRGLAVGARAVGRTPQAQMSLKEMGQRWRFMLNKMGKLAPSAAKFVGGVDEDAVKMAQKHGFQNTLTEEFLDPEKSLRIVKRVMLGSEKVLDEDLFINEKKGKRRLARNISDLKNPGLNQLVKLFTGMSDDAIGTIQDLGAKRVTSPINLADDRAGQLAKQIENAINKKDKLLGRRLAAIESKELKRVGSRPFGISDLAERFERIIEQAGFGRRRRPGFPAVRQAIDVPGAKQLRQILDEMTDAKGEFHRFISVSQATTMRRRIDLAVSALSKGATVPEPIKRVGFEFANLFRTRLHNLMKIGPASQEFSAFKTLSNQVGANRVGFLNQLENQIKNFTTQPLASKGSFNALFNEFPEAGFRNKIRLVGAANELKKVKLEPSFTKFANAIKKKDFLTEADSSFKESQLRTLESLLPKSRKFIKDAEKAAAANAFLGGSPNLLRVQTIAGMLSLGGLGLGVGGPALGGLGAVGGLALTQPRNLARALVFMERLFQGQIQAPKVFGRIGRIPQALGAERLEPTVPAGLSELASILTGQRST